jgi:hypothetical protein
MWEELTTAATQHPDKLRLSLLRLSVWDNSWTIVCFVCSHYVNSQSTFSWLHRNEHFEYFVSFQALPALACCCVPAWLIHIHVYTYLFILCKVWQYMELVVLFLAFNILVWFSLWLLAVGGGRVCMCVLSLKNGMWLIDSGDQILHVGFTPMFRKKSQNVLNSGRIT